MELTLPDRDARTVSGRVSSRQIDKVSRSIFRVFQFIIQYIFSNY